MNVDLTDKNSMETGPISLDIVVDDLAPLETDRAADGTRSKLTAAPPPIPARARKSSASLPPPIPQRAARGTEGPALPRTQTLSGKVSVVPPRASAEMMASWQINPEAPLPEVPPAIARTMSPPPIPLGAKAPSEPELFTTAKPEVVAAALTGNAPSVASEPSLEVAAPVVAHEIIPSPRDSRVEPLPTTQPGADVADLPQWPTRATLPLPTRRPSAARVSTQAMPSVLVAPEMAASRVSALDGSDAWVFEEDYEESRVDGEVVPTTYFERTETGARGFRPRYLVAIGAAAAAVALIVGIAMHSGAVEHAPVAAKMAPPEVVAAPVTPVVTKPMTTLPITSWPTGAVVTLVDNGAPTVLGPTPVNASLDPSHSYDVVLAVAGRPTTLRHVDLTTMHELAVDLDADPAMTKVAAQTAPAVEARPPVAPAAAPLEHHHHHHSAPTAAIVTPSFEAAPAPAARPKQVAMAPAVAGNGVLMISAKPPCEIIIDGKSTHLTTPQRSVAVAAGAHTVMLVNASMGIKKSIAVQVDAKKPTKLIEDFTKG